MPHKKLEKAKKVYYKTKNIEKARIALEEMFIIDIKHYKKLSNKQLDDILVKGWSTAGLNIDGKINVTKIPSRYLGIHNWSRC